MRSNFTGAWEPVNHTHPDTVEVAFGVANCLVLLVTLHTGILANLFVAWAVYHQKSLQTSNNALLVNLAVIDILRCVVDCPLLLGIALSARNARDLGVGFCSAQIASFSLICCVQLFTLACISAERYQAVAHPFKNAERRKRVTVSITVSWAVPICVSALCVIFAKDSPVYVKCRGLRMETLGSYDTFGFYILTPVWCVCLAVIIGFYARIFLLVRAHGRKIFDKGSFAAPDKKKEDKTKPKEEKQTNVKGDHDKTQIKDANDGFKTREKEPPGELKGSNAHAENETLKTATTDPSVLNQPESVFEKSKETKVTFIDELFTEATGAVDLHVSKRTQEHAAETSPSPANGDGVSSPNAPQEPDGELSVTSTNGEDGAEPNSHQEHSAKTSPSPAHEEGDAVEPTDLLNPALETSPSSTDKEGAVDTSAETSPPSNEDAQITTAPPQEEVMGAVCMMPSLAQRERGNAKKESKLAKRSGYIICTFLVFWIPLIATVVLNHFLYENRNLKVKVFRQLEMFTVSVVCMTSFTNPIIYAAVNPQFRTEFYNLKSKWKTFFTGS